MKKLLMVLMVCVLFLVGCGNAASTKICEDKMDSLFIEYLKGEKISTNSPFYYVTKRFRQLRNVQKNCDQFEGDETATKEDLIEFAKSINANYDPPNE
jgi:hypothetical protein